MTQIPSDENAINRESEVREAPEENEALRMILIETIQRIEKQDAQREEAGKQNIEKNDVQILILRRVRATNVSINSVYYAGQFVNELNDMLEEIRTKHISLKEMVSFSGMEAKECVECESDNYRIQCLLLNEMVEYYGIVQFILEEIKKKVEYGELIHKEMLDGFMTENSLDNRTILLEKYTQQFLKEHQFPPSELLIELSAQKYEGSESEARIYINNGSTQEQKKIFMFDEEGRRDYKLESGKLRTIRKLMEISKRDAMQLLADKDMKHIIGLISIDKDSRKEIDSQSNYICFKGYMQWSAHINGKEEICYKQGRYYINNSKNRDIYEKRVAEFEKQIELGIEQDVILKIRNLVTILKEQRHGTAVILTDDNNEAVRLCKVGRGMLIKQDEQQGFRIEENNFDQEKLLSITGIDGALFMDLKGRCTAFGVIVDGIAEVQGNTGRGARYNSIYNYIYQKRLESNERVKEEDRKQVYIYIALIFSEDGGVDIIDNLTMLRNE